MGTEIIKTQPADTAALENILASGATLDDFEIPRVSIPGSGGLQWEIPTGDPDNPEYVKEIEGVVINDYSIDTLHEKSFQDDPDGEPVAMWIAGEQAFVTPTGLEMGVIEGAPTSEQPLNQFGSARSGKGKAIQNKWRIFIGRPGHLLPLQINVSVMSRKNWLNFKMANLLGGSHNKLVTFRLVAKESSDKIKYASMVATVKSVLSDEEAANWAKYAEAMSPLTQFKARAVEASAPAEAEPVATVANVPADVVSATKEAFGATEVVGSDELPF